MRCFWFNSGYGRRIRLLWLSDDNSPDDWLVVCDRRVEAGWQAGDVRQLEALEGEFDAAEAGAGEGDFVGGEDGAEALAFGGLMEFGVEELVEGEEQGEFRGDFDSDSAGVWIARPALGKFCVHG